MASNLYVTVGEVKRRMDAVNADWSATETAALERIIEAVSRSIDTYCGRHFYQSGTTTTGVARYFTAEWGDTLDIPDLVSIATNGLTTDEDGDRTYETTWATTDYDLFPFNAAEVNWPYTEIHVTPSGVYSFPTVAKGVKITGVWGWPAVPPEIVEATVLESLRTWQHAQSPSGVASDQELGTWIVAPALHPKTKQLLMPLARDILTGAA